MTELKLLTLKLKNFKGIKSLELSPDGKDLKVFGENATGKTTIFDAFSWLLFDKDSNGNSQFDIKTLDEDGETIHHLEHEVEGVIELSNKELTFKKVYYEKWTKSRGSAKESFSGHTTDHYINDVPVKKSEYDQRINEIADEDIFKLVTNPAYFNEQLHWEDRREILLDVCGDVSDEDVIDNNSELEDLKEIISERDIEEHRKIIKGKMKKINEELDKIPIRIDEVSQGLPDVAGLDWKEIKPEIEDLKDKKQKKEQELARVENGGEAAEKKKKITEIETELQEIKNDHTAEYDEKIQEKKQKLSELKDQLDDIERDIKNKKSEIDTNNRLIEQLEEEKEQLKKNWFDVQAEKDNLNEQSWEGDKNCPTCGQDLPEGQIEEAKAKFNREKAERIEQMAEEQTEINQQGKSIVEKIKRQHEQIEQLQHKIDQESHDLSFKQDEIKKLEKKMKELQEQSKTFKDSDKYQLKLKEKEQLEDEIKQLKSNNTFSLQKIDEEIIIISEKIEEEQDKLNNIKACNRGQKRIEELESKQEDLSSKYEQLEKELYLTEEFTKTKVNLLESKINEKFRLATFKLFETQVNGGIKETCETLYKGVPYSSALNNGAQINVGLDIINTLSEHYGFRAPIFVDNSESVVNIHKIDSQMIKLIVSGKDKELRVEEES